MMKKRLMIIAALSITLLGFTACGNSATSISGAIDKALSEKEASVINDVEQSRWASDQDMMNSLLNMVKASIVEVGNAGGKLPGSTGSSFIKVTAAGIQIAGDVGKASDAAGQSIVGQLNSEDPNWMNYRLKNDGTHDPNGSSAYTITISADNGALMVKGTWGK